jgi:hypothetical protein
LFCSRAQPRASTWALMIAVLGAFGCGGTPSPAGSQTLNVAGGVTTAIAAGVLWAAGGGCRLQGCPYGSYCNHKSGFCEVRKCSQGCPDGTICNEGLGRCQAPPPAAPPNDFLPEDNLLQQRP